MRVDRDRIEQVIANLLDNALEASEEGGNVVIHTRTRDREAVVEVTDRGRGIAEERLETIFQSIQEERCQSGRRIIALCLPTGFERALTKLGRGFSNIMFGWAEIPVTYAGGIHNLQEIRRIEQLGKGQVDFTLSLGFDYLLSVIPGRTSAITRPRCSWSSAITS